MGDMQLTTLRRSPAPEAKVAGVCAGLATTWGIDPLLVRVAFVVLGLGGGVGLVLYAAAWLAVPLRGSDHAHLDDSVPGWRRWPTPAYAALLIGATVLTASVLSAVLPFGLAPSLVLLAVWFFGFHRPRRRVAEAERRREQTGVTSSPSAPFAQQTEFTRLAAQWQQRVHQHLDVSGSTPAPGPQPGPEAQDARPGVDMRSGQQQPWPAYTGHPGYSMDAFLADPDPVGLYAPATPAAGSSRVATARSRRRGNRALAWAGIAACGLAVGAVALLDVFFEVRPVAYLAAALLVIGLTLVAGTRWGRPRGFLALGVVLSLATLGAMAPHHPLTGGSGTRVVATSVDQIPLRLTRDTGPVDVDLSQVALTEDRRMEVAVDMGDIRVRVPNDARVRVEYTVDAGSVDVLTRHDGGVDLADTVDDPGSGQGPLLTVVAHADLGRVEVGR